MLPSQKFHYGNEGGFHRGLGISADMDTSDFQPDFDKFMDETMPKAGRKGLGMAMTVLMADVAEEVPTAPILTSALRGSMTVFVNKVVFALSKFGIPTFQSIRNSEPQWKDGDEGVLVVNAPYATVQHEEYPAKSEPGAGMYYVLKKLVMFRMKYAQIVVNELRKART